MEKKDTLSSCSESEEQQMQLIQDKSKESCMVSFQRLHSHLTRLSNNDLKGSRTENGFGRAFATLFGQDFEIFTGTMFLNMDQLQKQIDNNEFQEIGSMASFKVLETQFQMFIKSKIYLNDEYIVMTRNYFLQYTQLDIPEFRETLVQFMEYVKKSIDERALHKREYDSRVNERQIQTTEEKIDTSNALDALDASSVIIESNGTESQEQDTSSRSGNDAHVDDADIRPIYDEEPKAEVQMTTNNNVSAKGQQHTEQPEFINEGEIVQNAEQCHDTCPLPAKLTDNTTIELSNQLLESENVCLKKTVAQFQKDFSRMEAHCVNLELKYQNQVLKEGQQGQFLNVKSNEAKVKHDIDVIETINIELEHKVAKLLKENETLKRHYKEMFDSIKTTRAKNIEHTTSLIANNDKFKAQLQEKGFAIAALKNELRKLTGNSVNTKLNRQEKDANDAAEALRKEFAQQTEDLLLQAGAAKPSSTNIVNIASTPVSTTSPDSDLTNPDQDDSEIPVLEDIYQHLTDGIFTNSSYDDKGAVADFINLETVVNVSPIPTSRMNSIHPSTLILRDPQSAVQTRNKVTKSSGAHAFVTPKTSHLSTVKRIFRYLKDKPKLGFWYPRLSLFDLEAYSDSDYAGANLDRKSTTRGCQFLGRRLISWQYKKQTIVATSTTARPE
ncbi:hypothetical protein Tco_0755085 [Tanacetum coccineum]